MAAASKTPTIGTASAGKAGGGALVLVAPVVFLLLWSGGYAVAKIALEHVEPFTLLSLRYGSALIILLILFAVLRPPVPQRPAELGHIMFVGFLIQCVYFGLSYVAFWLGASAGAVALIVSLQPIVVGILAPLFVDERVTIWRWIGLLLGLAGAGLVIQSRSAVDSGSLWAVAAAVGALFGMSTAAIYEKRFGINAHPVTSNVLQYGIGFAMLTPIALQVETYRVRLGSRVRGIAGLSRDRQLAHRADAAARHDPPGRGLACVRPPLPGAAARRPDRLGADRRGHAANRLGRIGAGGGGRRAGDAGWVIGEDARPDRCEIRWQIKSFQASTSPTR